MGYPERGYAITITANTRTPDQGGLEVETGGVAALLYFCGSGSWAIPYLYARLFPADVSPRPFGIAHVRGSRPELVAAIRASRLI